MLRVSVISLFISLLLITGCKDVLESDNNGVTQDYAIYQIDFVFEGGSMHCYLSIPNSAYESSVLSPLILGLHWGDPDPYSASLTFLENFLLPPFQKLNPIILSPACPTNDDGGWSSESAEKALVLLIDSAKVWYPVDPDKFAITGYSMGGSGTWNFIAKYPDVFSAAIPVASLPPASLPAEADYPAITVVHGTADELVGIIAVDDRVELLKNAGINIQLIEAVGKSHYQTSRYNTEMGEAVMWLYNLWY